MPLSTHIRKLHPLRAMRPFLAPYRRWILSTLFFLVLAASVTLAFPLIIRQVIDQGFLNQTPTLLRHQFINLLFAAFILSLASSLRFYCVSWLGERVMTDLRQRVFHHVLTLSPTFYETTKVGEVISRLTTDTTLIERVIGTSISLALRNSILFLGALGMLIFTSWQLSLFVVILIPCIMIPIIAFGRSYRRLSRKSQDLMAQSEFTMVQQVQMVNI